MVPQRLLRLHDQPALQAAIVQAQQRQGWLLPVFVHDPAQDQNTAWGFQRMGAHRRAWLHSALCDLSEQLRALGSGLGLCQGDPTTVLAELCRTLGQPLLVCEEIAAPEEQAVVQNLRQTVPIHTVWQSTLLEPSSLPFAAEQVPDHFTAFRQAIERTQVPAPAPLAPPTWLPPWPSDFIQPTALMTATTPHLALEPRSSFPYLKPNFAGGERDALAHLKRYCQRGLPHSYKATRNGLTGIDYSS